MAKDTKESLSGRALRAAARSRRRRDFLGAFLRPTAPLLPRKPPPTDPVFILGSPRSGTTLVFEALGSSRHMASLEAESHLLWEMFHDVRSEWTHEVGEGDVDPRERKVLYWAIDRISLGRHYLDKAPRNCLRVPFLHAMFPGAWFVYVKRDGRAAVSSLITGWRAPGNLFPGTEMPVPLRIEGYDGSTWKFLVPRGWEAYAQGRRLEEVCAFQWVAANESLLEAKDRIGIERWIEVSYEDFVDSPTEQTSRIMERLEIPFGEEVRSFVQGLDGHVTKAITPPRRDKWRNENPREIERIVPMIAPLMRRMGYEVEVPGTA